MPQGDLLAQLVEHNTFNVGVMGSSPIQVTVSEKDFPLREVLFSYMVRDRKSTRLNSSHQ